MSIDEQFKTSVDHWKEHNPNRLTSGLNYLQVSRTLLRMTMAEMAELLEVCPATYGAWEREQRSVPERRVKRLEYILAREATNFAPHDIWTAQTAVALMKHMKLSSAEFARRVGVSRQTVHLWTMEPQYRPSHDASMALTAIRNQLLGKAPPKVSRANNNTPDNFFRKL